MKRFLGGVGIAAVLAVGLPIPTGNATAIQDSALPSIELLSPTHPVTVQPNGKIPIRVRVRGIKLSPNAMGRKNVPGQGHYHFYIDCIPSAAYSRPNNFGGCWAGAVASERTVFDLRSSQVPVTTGAHVLFLALAQNDHVLYDAPPVAILFRVVKVPISLQLISPTRPVTVRLDGKIPIHVKVTGITLNKGAMGRKNVPGQGHYHFYIDCIPSAAYSRPNNFGGCWAGAVAIERTVFDLRSSQVPVKPGTHNLYLALAQNDHVLYRAPAVDIVFTATK
jgi:hypothetical protein